MRIQPFSYLIKTDNTTQQNTIRNPFNQSNDILDISFKGAAAKLTSKINVQNLKKHIRFLASIKCAGRFPNTNGSEIARKYIIKQLQKYGIKPFRKIAGKDYIHSGLFEKTYQGTKYKGIKAEGTPLRINNIVGYIPAKSDEYLVITAHYDHLGRSMNTGKIFSGAEDNASGVAVLLETARLLSKERPKINIVFVATDGEEIDQLGAKCLAKKMQEVGIKKKSRVINIDSVGAKGDFITIEGGKGIKGNKSLSDAGKEAAKKLGIKYKLGPRNFRTDAFAMEQEKVPAISFVWSWVHNESNRPFMHTTRDKAKVIHYTNVAKTTQVLLNTIYELFTQH